ncbi:MAG: cupin domain-containing protein [Candidatus Rokubacteria bacterium]|nr:cupin domain-containing protein [Candidatus Rokubacteria bacterium]
MRHDETTDAVRATAALYALGALSPEEAAAFEAHLAEGCRACHGQARAFEALASHLGVAVAPVPPPPGLRARLLARIRPHPASAMVITRAGEGRWQRGGAAGVRTKRLFRDATDGRVTTLVHLEAGVEVASHQHCDIEELYVLEGVVTVARVVLAPGDYAAALPGRASAICGSSTGGRYLVVTREAGAERAVEDRLTVVRAADGGWRRGPGRGIEIRPIFSDPARGTLTAVVRMAPGSILPRHRHATLEQFYVLTGEAELEGQRLRAGDYCRAPGASAHGESRSAGGCRFFLISSRVELIDR